MGITERNIHGVLIPSITRIQLQLRYFENLFSNDVIMMSTPRSGRRSATGGAVTCAP